MSSAEQASPSTNATWGGDNKLTAFEQMMWEFNHYPNLRSAVCSVEIINGSPSPEQVEQRISALVAQAPRLAEKLQSKAGLSRGLYWVKDTNFRIENHLTNISLGGGAALEEVFSLSQNFAMEDFDPQQSPWKILFITGLEEDKSALVFKIHHSMSDGIGISQLLALMHDPLQGESPSSSKTQPSNAPQADQPPRATLFNKLALANPVNKLAQLQSSLRKTSQRLTEKPLNAHLSDGARFLGSLDRVLQMERPANSPLLAARSYNWSFHGLSLPLSKLKQAAKQNAVKLNDIYVAGILAGFDGYHQAMGAEQPSLPLCIPVSVRSEGKSGGGNHFIPFQLDGPLKATPETRMKSINKQVAKLRNEPAVAAPMAVMPILPYLPPKVVAKQMADQLAVNDIQLSNVPGYSTLPTLCNHTVEACYPFAPLPGCAAMITLLSFGENCFLGFNLDDKAITQPELLLECVEKGFNEIFSTTK